MRNSKCRPIIKMISQSYIYSGPIELQINQIPVNYSGLVARIKEILSLRLRVELITACVRACVYTGLDLQEFISIIKSSRTPQPWQYFNSTIRHCSRQPKHTNSDLF